MKTGKFQHLVIVTTTLCSIGIFSLIAGCTQSRSGTWAQKTPAVKATPVVIPQGASSSSQLTEAPMLKELDRSSLNAGIFQ